MTMVPSRLFRHGLVQEAFRGRGKQRIRVKVLTAALIAALAAMESCPVFAEGTWTISPSSPYRVQPYQKDTVNLVTIYFDSREDTAGTELVLENHAKIECDGSEAKLPGLHVLGTSDSIVTGTGSISGQYLLFFAPQGNTHPTLKLENGISLSFNRVLLRRGESGGDYTPYIYVNNSSLELSDIKPDSDRYVPTILMNGANVKVTDLYGTDAYDAVDLYYFGETDSGTNTVESPVVTFNDTTGSSSALTRELGHTNLSTNYFYAKSANSQSLVLNLRSLFIKEAGMINYYDGTAKKTDTTGRLYLYNKRTLNVSQAFDADYADLQNQSTLQIGTAKGSSKGRIGSIDLTNSSSLILLGKSEFTIDGPLSFKDNSATVELGEGSVLTVGEVSMPNTSQLELRRALFNLNGGEVRVKKLDDRDSTLQLQTTSTTSTTNSLGKFTVIGSEAETDLRLSILKLGHNMDFSMGENAKGSIKTISYVGDNPGYNQITLKEGSTLDVMSFSFAPNSTATVARNALLTSDLISGPAVFNMEGGSVSVKTLESNSLTLKTSSATADTGGTFSVTTQLNPLETLTIQDNATFAIGSGITGSVDTLTMNSMGHLKMDEGVHLTVGSLSATSSDVAMSNSTMSVSDASTLASSKVSLTEDSTLTACSLSATSSDITLDKQSDMVVTSDVSMTASNFTVNSGSSFSAVQLDLLEGSVANFYGISNEDLNLNVSHSTLNVSGTLNGIFDKLTLESEGSARASLNIGDSTVASSAMNVSGQAIVSGPDSHINLTNNATLTFSQADGLQFKSASAYLESGVGTNTLNATDLRVENSNLTVSPNVHLNLTDDGLIVTKQSNVDMDGVTLNTTKIMSKESSLRISNSQANASGIVEVGCYENASTKSEMLVSNSAVNVNQIQVHQYGMSGTPSQSLYRQEGGTLQATSGFDLEHQYLSSDAATATVALKNLTTNNLTVFGGGRLSLDHVSFDGNVDLRASNNKGSAEVYIAGDSTLSSGSSLKTDLLSSEGHTLTMGFANLTSTDDSAAPKIQIQSTKHVDIHVAESDPTKIDAFYTEHYDDVNRLISDRFCLTDSQSTLRVDSGLVSGPMVYTQSSLQELPNAVNQDFLESLNLYTGVARTEMNDIRKRLGDLRFSESDYAGWVRYDGGRLSDDGDYRNKFNKFQIGADIAVSESVRMGASFSYTRSDIKHTYGDSDVDTYGVSAYAGWYSDSGVYVDGIFRYARQKTDGMTQNYDANFSNNVYSVSMESGYTVFFGTDAWSEQFHPFIEPQLELTYTHMAGSDFSAKGARFEVDSQNSLIGRVGLLAGIMYPQEQCSFYVRASLVREFLGDGKLTGTNGALRRFVKSYGKDTWFEYALGGQWNISPYSYFYLDLERTAGAKVNEDIRVNVGYRQGF